jgi:hypothetical protein
MRHPAINRTKRAVFLLVTKEHRRTVELEKQNGKRGIEVLDESMRPLPIHPTRVRTAPTGKKHRKHHTGHAMHTALQTKKSKQRPQTQSAEDYKKNNSDRKRGRTQINTRQPIHDKRFITTTGKVITMVKLRGRKAIDELLGSNRDKVRLISRAAEKQHGKGKKNGSRFWAIRTALVREMALEEARNTEVDITKNSREKYGNAHIIYDTNGGLIDIILEVVPTAEQRAERAAKAVDHSQIRSTMTKEKEYEIQEKYRPKYPEGT